ncbi:sensor histidine kinase [Chondrinema litorale]|uniref:sensor histidine kinase n=1 Tax=Chondrinema litorale TaxID=2994555 RepID=UPI002543AF6C|nr:GAF domain-containing sensor histidine kinase [Chondrinema litorale]UZR99892.1 GAF domain-containing sensor histidine kinase [Chondrinema litorale]
MIEHQKMLEASSRLRYEAFAKLATDLSRSMTFDEIAKVLLSQLKYIIDIYCARIYIQFLDTRMVFDILRNQVEYYQADSALPFEKEVLASGVPVLVSPFDEKMKSFPEFFQNPKITKTVVFPNSLFDDQNIILTISSKEGKPYTEMDFRFFKLIGEFLYNKAYQLYILENLEKIVAKRTSELKNLNTELQQLFYRASHDFKRPLTTISGLINLAGMVPDEEKGEIFNKVNYEVETFKSMLDKLSTLSVLDIQKEAYQFETLGAISSNLDATFETALKEKEIHLHWLADPEEQAIIPSPAISGLLQNLIENSIAFHDHKKDVRNIWITYEKDETEIYISVEDNGIGIEDQFRHKVFEMYFRAHPFSKGNGLGLYVVKKITENFNGSFEVDSNLGKRTKITLTFPINL